MSTQPAPKSLGVIYPSSINPNEWESNFHAGLVPDQWPYGLHRLGKHPFHVTALQGRPLGLEDKVVLGSRLLTGHQKRAQAATPLDVSIAWDEYTAAKMVAQHPGHARFSGVIWATDAWSAGNVGIRNTVVRRMLSQLTGLWCLSRPQVEELERHTGQTVGVDFLPFGVDQNFFSFSSAPERGKILSLGVDRDRNPEMLFEALEIIHHTAPDVEIMVQSNSTRALPQGVSRFSRVPHAVLRDMYRTSSVVLVPTKHNLHASGMTVALEAGATGRPVVACMTPGMEDYVIDGTTGRLVEVGDSAGMAAATLEILHDREFALALGVEARRHVERSHSSELMVQRLGEILDKRL